MPQGTREVPLMPPRRCRWLNSCHLYSIPNINPCPQTLTLTLIGTGGPAAASSRKASCPADGQTSAVQWWARPTGEAPCASGVLAASGHDRSEHTDTMGLPVPLTRTRNTGLILILTLTLALLFFSNANFKLQHTLVRTLALPIALALTLT